jgi:hypothetical protein
VTAFFHETVRVFPRYGSGFSTTQFGEYHHQVFQQPTPALRESADFNRELERNCDSSHSSVSRNVIIRVTNNLRALRRSQKSSPKKGRRYTGQLKDFS